MRAVVLYKENTDCAREVTEFLHDFERQTGRELEVINPETPEGIQFCGTYDIVSFPTVIALSDEGIMQQTWRGLPMPTIMEVSYYVQQS